MILNDIPKNSPGAEVKNLIEIFTDVGDVVIDPCAGSGVTLLAAEHLGRKSYGFEIKKEFVKDFNEKLAKKCASSFDQLQAVEKSQHEKV